MSTDPDRSQRRKARTRSALVAAARHLFAAQGMESTTIAQIADLADVAVGSFYNHFETKDELLAALVHETLGEQLARLQSRQAKVEDVAEKVSIAHRHLVELAQLESDWAWMLVRLEVPHRVINLSLGAAASEDLESGLESGRFQVADARVALQASGGALRGVIHALLLGELGPDAGSAHAEGVLRSFGLDPEQAAEIAARPLPPSE